METREKDVCNGPPPSASAFMLELVEHHENYISSLRHRCSVAETAIQALEMRIAVTAEQLKHARRAVDDSSTEARKGLQPACEGVGNEPNCTPSEVQTEFESLFAVPSCSMVSLGKPKERHPKALAAFHASVQIPPPSSSLLRTRKQSRAEPPSTPEAYWEVKL